jgi:plasmid stabilization system protein ParE
MAYEILISNDAVYDVQDAAHYYNMKKTGLGDRFIDHLESSINSIANNPYIMR